MDLDLVDPELRTFVRRLSRIGVPTGRVSRPIARVALKIIPFRREPSAVTTRLREGRVRGFHYAPGARRSAPGPSLFWIHGGGLITGAPQIDHLFSGRTAVAVGIDVFSFRYRLAPAHPFPAALDDLTDAWHWLQSNAARLGVDPTQIVVGGESAGGGLVAALTQRLLDDGGVQPIGQWLFAPMLDDRTAARRDLDAIDHFIWNNRANHVGWSSYLGREPGAPTLPPYAAAARREDLAGLPPAWLQWGTLELFADECADYAARLKQAGVPVTTGMWHDITNTGDEPMRLYVIYAPSHHAPGKVHPTRAESEADEESGEDEPPEWTHQPE